MPTPGGGGILPPGAYGILIGIPGSPICIGGGGGGLNELPPIGLLPGGAGGIKPCGGAGILAELILAFVMLLKFCPSFYLGISIIFILPGSIFRESV